jgi:hypothetical protein
MLKMKRTTLLSALLVAMFSMSAAQAQTPGPAQAGISAEIGSTGVGAHLTYNLMDHMNVRVGANGANYSYSGSTSDADYNVRLKLNTLDALLDYYPGQSAFRVTGGLVYNNNKIDVNAKSNSSGSYTFNGNTYTAASAGTINGAADFRKIAPYLGIGYGNALGDSGFSFTSDLGVMFQGSANTTITNSGCTAPAAVCTQLASDLSTENAKLADKLNSMKLYPVARIGISYRF